MREVITFLKVRMILNFESISDDQARGTGHSDASQTSHLTE